MFCNLPTRLTAIWGEEKVENFFNPFMVSIIFSNIFLKRFDDKAIILHNSFLIFLGIFSSPSLKYPENSFSSHISMERKGSAIEIPKNPSK